MLKNNGWNEWLFGVLEAPTTSDIIICDYLVSEGKVQEFWKLIIAWQAWLVANTLMTPVLFDYIDKSPLVTGDSPYSNICTEVGIRLMSPNKDSCRYKASRCIMRLYRSSIQPDIWVLHFLSLTKEVWCACLRCQLILFTWKVWIWWNSVCCPVVHMDRRRIAFLRAMSFAFSGMHQLLACTFRCTVVIPYHLEWTRHLVLCSRD